VLTSRQAHAVLATLNALYVWLCDGYKHSSNTNSSRILHLKLKHIWS